MFCAKADAVFNVMNVWINPFCIRLFFPVPTNGNFYFAEKFKNINFTFYGQAIACVVMLPSVSTVISQH